MASTSNLAKRIIPCLDVTAGRVVKGVNFVDLRDAGDPVEIARRYSEQGADELTFLDITATSDQRDIILSVVEACAAQIFIPLTVGGGVRTVADVRRAVRRPLGPVRPAPAHRVDQHRRHELHDLHLFERQLRLQAGRNDRAAWR